MALYPVDEDAFDLFDEGFIERTSPYRRACEHMCFPPIIRKITGELREALDTATRRRRELVRYNKEVTILKLRHGVASIRAASVPCNRA